MLNKSNRKTINVDSSNLVPIYTFKQEDDGVLLLSLFKNSIPLDLTGQSIKLGIKRPNGTIVSIETLGEDNPFTIDQNNLDIKFKNSAFAIPGLCECDLELVDVNGKMTTASFYITVNKKVVGDTNIQATNDIAILNKIKLEEEKREAAEEDRANKEVSREKAESIRANSENTRIENENLRKSNEETRVSNENARVTNEEARKTKENERLENENNRVLSEATREDNEADRVLNEKNRVSKENERIENETNRVKSESDRVTAENDRVSNETERKSNEQKRVSAEEEREANEIARQTAYKEIQDARVDYFGTEHNDLQERLNEDFDNVHQRVNESSLLPYEGTNITASDSYYGLIKDLTIKGKTLQNLHTISAQTFNYYGIEKDTDFTIEVNNNITTVTRLTDVVPSYAYLDAGILNKDLLKPNTVYTLVFEKATNLGKVSLRQNNNQNLISNDSIITNNMAVLTTTNDLTIGVRQVVYITLNGWNANSVFELGRVMILEGDYTNTPLSELHYFEGIKSVGENEVTEDGKYKVKAKSCGKNLFDGEVELGMINYVTGTMSDNSTIVRSKKYIKVKPNTKYTLSSNSQQLIVYICYDSKYNFISGGAEIGSVTFATPKNCCFIKIRNDNNGNLKPSIQLEEGTVATDYEPYKEQLIEYLLDEPLRSSPNGAEDEIVDAKLIMRCGEVIITGNENIVLAETSTNTLRVNINTAIPNSNISKINVLCDKLPSYSQEQLGSLDINGISSHSTHGIQIRIDKSLLTTSDIQGVQNWVKANPLKVIYDLISPIEIPLKEVSPLKLLWSQDDTTHITSDNLLPPTISCKIPSNIPAVISALRLENETLQNENAALTEQIEENNIINIETSLEQDARLTMLELGVN